ncbi:recombinase RecT, partial [Acinetobacter sp. HY1485]|uniref:recombinase RecT n=1 Tax=Acinetobacter sp. HY1485 TaxID=2970918 RepID=UPI0022B9B0C3
IATMLASSTMVPEQYRKVIDVKVGKDSYGNAIYEPRDNPNGVANSIVAVNMANRLGADPLMIMQNLYIIDGRPSWSSQFVIASINSSGKYSSLRFDVEDRGEVELTYVRRVWEYNQGANKKLPKDIQETVKVRDLVCKAWAIEKETGERLESAEISMRMAVAEGWYQKNGSKWQTMPEQMLRYRAAAFFGRIYAPELLMGIKTQEEELDNLVDVTPEPAEETPAVNSSDLRKSVTKDPEPQPAEEIKAEQVEPKVETTPAEPTPVAQEAKAPTPIVDSTKVRTKYIKEINALKSVDGVQKKLAQAIADDGLSTTHKQYLEAHAKQRIEQINQPDATKSELARNEHIQFIQGIKSLEELKKAGAVIAKDKPNMTRDDQNAVATEYAQQYERLSQGEILDDLDDDAVIKKIVTAIEHAKNIDDLNAIMAEPYTKDFSGIPEIDQAYENRLIELGE